MTTAELQMLLQRARDQGLEATRSYRLFNSGYRASPEEFASAKATLEGLCERAAYVRESLLWFEEQKSAWPTGVTSLGIEALFGQHESLKHRFRRHDVEVFRDLHSLRLSLETQLASRVALEGRLDHLRSRLDALKETGTNVDFFELSLSRLEGQALFGHDPDEARMERFDEGLKQAEEEYERSRHFDDENRLKRLAEAFIERQKDRMTVSQSQKIQTFLDSLNEPASRRGLWNLLRASEQENHTPLEFLVLNVSTRLSDNVEALSDSWKALTARYGQSVEGAQG